MFLIQSKFIGEINRFFDRSGFKPTWINDMLYYWLTLHALPTVDHATSLIQPRSI